MHPEFPQEGIIHLNHAAVGPWPRRTEDAVCRFARENVAHGSRDYLQCCSKSTRRGNSHGR